MPLLIPSCLFFALFYFTMRFLKEPWEKRKLPPWSRFFLGFLAWGTALSFGGILGGLLLMVAAIFSEPGFGSGFGLMFFLLGSGLIAKYANANPELFDFPAMKPFLKDSLAFVNPALRWTNVFEELDRHEVRRIYKEVSGRELRNKNDETDQIFHGKLEEAKSAEFFSKDTRVASPGEVHDLLRQPIRSLHFAEEQRRLHQGELVDISDSWHINTLKGSPHEYSRLVQKATVDPTQKQISFELWSDQFTSERVRDPVSLYRLKQNLYDFFQAVYQEEWAQGYLKHITGLFCVCIYLEDQPFTGIHLHPVFQVEISCADLKAYEHRFYDVGRMTTKLLI